MESPQVPEGLPADEHLLSDLILDNEMLEILEAERGDKRAGLSQSNPDAPHSQEDALAVDEEDRPAHISHTAADPSAAAQPGQQTRSGKGSYSTTREPGVRTLHRSSAGHSDIPSALPGQYPEAQSGPASSAHLARPSLLKPFISSNTGSLPHERSPVQSQRSSPRRFRSPPPPAPPPSSSPPPVPPLPSLYSPSLLTRIKAGPSPSQTARSPAPPTLSPPHGTPATLSASPPPVPDLPAESNPKPSEASGRAERDQTERGFNPPSGPRMSFAPKAPSAMRARGKIVRVATPQGFVAVQGGDAPANAPTGPAAQTSAANMQKGKRPAVKMAPEQDRARYGKGGGVDSERGLKRDREEDREGKGREERVAKRERGDRFAD